MNKILNTTTTPSGEILRCLKIDAPAAWLDALESASKANPERAHYFLNNKDFHGSAEICNFPTLRAAVVHGIPAETRTFKGALEAINKHAIATRLKRTDEASRIFDPAAYLEGVPECFYKAQPQTRAAYNITAYISAPWVISPQPLQNRAAAIIALAKRLKAERAAVSLEIATISKTDAGQSHEIKIPINLAALNIGQFAFMVSPAFFRTYIFMTYENIYNNWNRPKSMADKTHGQSEPADGKRINFRDIYMATNLNGIKTKRQARKAYIEQTEEKYGTPDRAFKTIKAEFKSEIERLKKWN